MDLLIDNPGLLVSAVIRAASVGCALLAAGMVLVNTLWLDTDALIASRSPRTIVSTCLIATVALTADWINTAKQLYGEASSAFDPLVLESVLATPPGQFYTVALVGLVWVFLFTLGARTLPYLAVPGAIAVIGSIGLLGHTLSEPRWLLYGLLSLHLGLVALWMGVLLPLSRLTRQPRNRGHAADLAEDIGRWGFAILPLILLAGGLLGWLLLGKPTSVPTTDYASLLQIKLLLFVALVAIGAVNRFAIVPRLHDSLAAGTWLRATLWLEGLLFAAILITISATTQNFHPMPLH
ncbi:MAG: CopD family protein [Pseudomonadota bacterium]